MSRSRNDSHGADRPQRHGSSKRTRSPRLPAADTGASENDEAGHPDDLATITSYFRSAAPHWDEVYERGDTFAVITQDRRAAALAFVDQLGLPRDSRVLEVGCGAGSIAVALARHGYVVEAIDVVDAMLDLARRRAAEGGVAERLSTSFGDVHHLGFRSEVFSLVLAVGVSQWLRSIDQALQEMARVLKPDGYLVATAIHGGLRYALDPLLCRPLEGVRRSLRELLQRTGLRGPRRGPRPRVHSIKEFDAALSAVGLEKVRGMTVGFGPFTFLGFEVLPDSVGVKVHRKLQELADRELPLIRSAGAQYLVLAKKVASNSPVAVKSGSFGAP